MVVGETKCYKTGSAPPQIDEQQLNVYSMRFCPFAERVRLILNVKHVPYNVININIMKKPEWFLLKNPLGKVPAIEIPGKSTLFESLICAECVDEVYPGTKTVSSADPYERARQKLMIEIICQKILAPFYAVLYQKNPDSDVLLKAMDEVEIMLNANYFAGDAMGFVDLMVWPWFERLPAMKEVNDLTGLTQERYPKLMAWSERMLTDPDVKATTYPHELFVESVRNIGKGTSTYDEGL